MKRVSVRLDEPTIHEFELMAKIKHQTKSELLKELINNYLMNKRRNIYMQAIENIAKHERDNPEKYDDIYDLRLAGGSMRKPDNTQ